MTTQHEIYGSESPEGPRETPESIIDTYVRDIRGQDRENPAITIEAHNHVLSDVIDLKQREHDQVTAIGRAQAALKEGDIDGSVAAESALRVAEGLVVAKQHTMLERARGVGANEWNGYGYHLQGITQVADRLESAHKANTAQGAKGETAKSLSTIKKKLTSSRNPLSRLF